MGSVVVTQAELISPRATDIHTNTSIPTYRIRSQRLVLFSRACKANLRTKQDTTMPSRKPSSHATLSEWRDIAHVAVKANIGTLIYGKEMNVGIGRWEAVAVRNY